MLISLASLLSAAARAQVSYAGVSARENFGSQSIGSASAAQSFSFSISAGATVGSIGVVTTGLANMDFVNAPGSTCAAQTYSSAATCVVNVTFTPMAAGPRMGAVVFYSRGKNSGAVLGSVPLYGIGTGPQIAYGPGAVSIIDRSEHSTLGLSDPVAMTVDAAGNLFILDNDTVPSSYRLVKIAAAGGSPTAIDPSVNGEALYLPCCVALDGAGDLLIADFYGRVVEVPPGGGAATALFPVVNGIPLNHPSGLTVDGAGDLFIGDYINNRVLEMPAGGGAPIALSPAVDNVPMDDPHGLAVDGAGNLFIADLGNGRIVELPAGGGAATAIEPTVNGEGLQNPDSVSVDAAGDLFISDNVNHRVVEVPAGGGAANAIDPPMYFGGAGAVYSVTVDAAGNLYFVQGALQGGANVLEKVLHALPPALNFATATDTGTTDTVDGAETVQVFNIGNEPLTLTALSYPADFAEADGDSNSCTGATSLTPGQECDLSIDFTPVNGGALSETVTLTDNALNGAGAQQSIALSATGEAQTVLASPLPGSTLAGPSVVFSWTPGIGATAYYLLVGSTGVGSSDVYKSGKVRTTSMTANYLPTNGGTVYVRLITYFNLTQMYVDYTYTASTQAQLTAPAAGSLLPGPAVNFAWTAGTGASAYILWLGSTGVGSKDLYSAGQNLATSVTVAKLPTNGETIYARLYTNFSGGQAHADYTFTAPAQAVLTSPAPGTLLSGSTVTFTWTAGTSATGYALWLGSTAAASSDLYNSGPLTVTSSTVNGLPANGETVYARLFTTINGVQLYTDYTYTAAIPATLTSPAPGSTLAGSSATFKWTARTGATAYQLLLGTTAAGSSNLYNSGSKTATSLPVAGLPTNGKRIYARILTNFKGTWVHADFILATRNTGGLPGSIQITTIH